MNMEIIGPLLLSLLAGLSTVIGSLFIFIKIRKINEFIVFSLSFSISIMILISLFDLFPNSFTIITNNYGYLYGFLIIILVFSLGWLTVYLITDKINNNSSLYKIGILSMISLMLHNFPEGILVFMSSFISIKYGIKLFLAIVLHNIPEGISIAIPIFYSTKSRGKAILMTFISGVAEPIGAILSFMFLRNYINNLMIGYILIFVCGLMMSLSINEIYKEISSYKLKLYELIGYTAGIIVLLVTSFVF